MDADDIAMPDRLEKQIVYLDEHADVLVCGCQAIRIDRHGKEIGPYTCPLEYSRNLLALIKADCPLVHPGTTFRAAKVISVGGYDTCAKVAEDFDLWWRLSYHGRIVNHPDVLLKYRWHGGNASIVQGERLRRGTIDITVRNLLRTGIAPSEDIALAFLDFYYNADPVSRQPAVHAIEGFCTIVDRFLAHLACSPFSRQYERDGVELSLLWDWVNKARTFPWFHPQRYRMFTRASRLFPRAGQLGSIVRRKLDKYVAPLLQVSDSQGVSSSGIRQ